MAYTVPRLHTNHASTTPSRRENVPYNRSSGFRPMPVLPQSPSTPTFQDDVEDSSMNGSISTSVSNVDEDGELPVARSSTSRPPSMISRMFTPRKKVISMISIGSSSSGHGPSALPNGEPRKRVTSFMSTASQNAEDAYPISSSAPVMSPLSSVSQSSSDAHTSRNIARKGFEPVGYIAKAPKKSLWKKKSQAQGSEGPFASSFSASTTSLVLGGNQAKRKDMRRASLSSGTWRLFSRNNGDIQRQKIQDEETLSGSEDEIDEIRRPSDLGPAAEVMAPEGEEAESSYDIPSDLQEELDQRFPWTSAPPRSEPEEKQRQVLTNPALLSHILTLLPIPDVARLATVSRSWSGSAKVALYGCLDLRLGASGIRAVVPEQLGRGRSGTVTAHQFQAEHRERSHSEEDASLMKRRSKLRRRLELLIDALRVRNGELFEGTRTLLMDEWPSGWESLVTGWEPEVKPEIVDGDVQDDAESIHTEYTAYSESDFAHTISDLGKGSTTSLLLDIANTTGRRETSRSPSPVYHLSISDSPLNSLEISTTNLFHSPRKMRAHPKTLMTTLLASLPSLVTLCLPAFHYPILRHHTAFGLRNIEFLSEEMGERETEEMLRWLDGMVGVREFRIGGRDREKSEGEDEESDVEASDSGNVKPPASNGARNSSPKKKRKTLLIISTPDALLAPSAPDVGKPERSSMFPGTSFPIPPSSMLDRRASALGVRAITGRTLSLGRPTSLLVPPALHSPMNMASVSLPSSPIHLQARSSIATPPQSAAPSSVSPSPTTPASSAYHTPTLMPATPVTPDSHTPMSSISPTSPLTPFTPTFYLHSLSTPSLPLTPSFVPSFSGGSGIRELCLRETLLPELRVFHGPPRLVKLIVPPRRKTIREVRMNVKSTIVSGEMKIRDIIQALRLSEKHGECDALEKLGFLFHKDTDRRTVEKVLGAAGAIVSSHESGKASIDEDGVRGTEEYTPDTLADKQAKAKGIHTLEVVFASEFRMHPNVRKSDEIIYKAIHAILPRYYGLQVVLLRREGSEPDDNQIRLHQEMTQIASRPPATHGEKSAATSSQQEQTEDETDANGPVDNDVLFLPQGSHDPTSGTTNPENSITFPSLSPPPSPMPPSASSSVSLEKQKLRDRKMKRRLGNSNGSADTSLNSALRTAESWDGLETQRPTGISSVSPEPADDEMDRETLQSNSSQGNKRKVRSIRSIRSISSIGSLASLGSLTMATTTKAVVQVVNATKAKAMIFRASGTDTIANGDTIMIGSTTPKPMDRGDSSPQPTTGALTRQTQSDYLKLEEKEGMPPMVAGTIELVNDALTSSQRRYVRLWTRMCPSLMKIVFLNGGIWMAKSS